LAVVPLDKVDVALPPGGRRVFREHAPTDARNGYEFVLIHVPDEHSRGETRPAAFLVAESLALRETWITALRMRANVVGQDTKLRPNTGTRRTEDLLKLGQDAAGLKSAARNAARKRAARGNSDDDMEEKMQQQEMEMASREFGVIDFQEEEWINDFFSTNNDFQAGAKIDELEQWQSNIKRGLRGAVLEQYEYFVEASREMTTMGKEVTSLKALVESQNEVIKEMKEIDFTAAFVDGDVDSLAGDEDDISEEPSALPGGRKNRRRASVAVQSQSIEDDDDNSDASTLSSDDEAKTKPNKKGDGIGDDDDAHDSPTGIEFPPWLDDVSEEIAAFIKESRYSDATSLLFKAKNKVSEILTLVRSSTELYGSGAIDEKS
jgi:hypothetical protein